MSTAAKVPETWKLTGDDARKTLVETGRLKLVKNAFDRLRAADGFSHARSLAFVTSLVLVQGLVALVGFTVLFGDLRISKEIIQAIQVSFPGPVGALLTDAVAQARKVGGGERYLPLLVGLAGTIVTGTTAMGQIERGFNRIYGIEQDRPVLRKYGRAFLLAMGAGTILACNFVVFTWGRGNGATDDLLGPTSPVVRWPIALLVAGLALAAMLRFAPFRRQPAWSWLAFGAAFCVVGWGLVTLVLGVFLQVSTSFGDTYGPLAGIVALQLWALFSSIAILFGAAIAAQLEAVRAGAPEPRDEPVPEGLQERESTASYAS
ncbi:MAG: YihY/virulence factor BrkB family protein [Actinomycetota bacterium]|nr:YihY/virulence factor BrkB family protein [Actinomycetota bacterium]